MTKTFETIAIGALRHVQGGVVVNKRPNLVEQKSWTSCTGGFWHGCGPVDSKSRDDD